MAARAGGWSSGTQLVVALGLDLVAALLLVIVAGGGMRWGANAGGSGAEASGVVSGHQEGGRERVVAVEASLGGR